MFNPAARPATRRHASEPRRRPGPGPPPLALALIAALLLPAAAASAGVRCHLVGNTGRDIGIADADSTLGPWRDGWMTEPRLARAASSRIAWQPPLLDVSPTTVDMLRRRVESLRSALDALERKLDRIQMSLRSLEMSTNAAHEELEPIPLLAGSSRGAFVADPIAPDPYYFTTRLGPADSIDLEAAPFETPASEVSAASWMPSAQLVELLLQVAAIAFLAAVLLVPFGCWLAAGAIAGVRGATRSRASPTFKIG